MSMATLERAVVAGARVVFKNPKLRNKDLQEWSTGKIEPHDGEVVAWIPNPGAWAAIKKENDKRESSI